MKLFGKNKEASQKQEKSAAFLEKTKELEPQFLEFLNASLAFAQKQPIQADKELIASYTESVGGAVQEVYAILEAKNKLAMLGRIPVIFGYMKKIESTTLAMEKRQHEFIDFEAFQVEINKIGMTLEAALAGLKP